MRLSPRVLPRARPPTRKNRGRRAARASAGAVAKTPGPTTAIGGEDEELTRLLRRAEEALAPPAEARDDAPASPPSMFAPPPAESREGLPAARSHGNRRSGGRKPIATPRDGAKTPATVNKGSRKKSAASQSSNEARSSHASTASAAAVASGAASGTPSSAAKKKKRRFQLKSLRRKKPARTGAPPEAPPPTAEPEPSAKVPADVENTTAENPETKEEREAKAEEQPAADDDAPTLAAAAVAGITGLCGWGCGPAEERDAASVGKGPVRTDETTNSQEEGGNGGGVWQMIGAWLSKDAACSAPNDDEVAKAAFVATADGVPAEGSGSRGGEEGSATAAVATDGKATDSATNDEAKPQPVDAKGVERAVDDAAPALKAQRLQAEEDEKARTTQLQEMEALTTAERQRNADLAARIAAQDDELRRMRDVVAGLRADNDPTKQRNASRSTTGAPAVAAAVSLDRGSFDRRPSPRAVGAPDAERWKLQAIIEGLEGDVAAERRRKEEALAAEEALRMEMDLLAREAATAEEARAAGREGDSLTADRGSASLDSADRSSFRSLDTRETDEGHGWFAQLLPAVSEDEESTVREDDLVDWSRSLSTLESDAVGASRTESCELEEEEAEEEAESGLSWTGLAL